jgi:hypothetical protein
MRIVALVYVMAKTKREKKKKSHKTKNSNKKNVVSGDTVVSSIKKIELE